MLLLAVLGDSQPVPAPGGAADTTVADPGAGDAGAGADPAGEATPEDDGFDPAAFRTPSATDRPAAFWFWNDGLDVDRLVAQLEDLDARGISQVIIHARRGLAGGPAGDGTGDAEVYLSSAWFDAVERVVQRAAELDVAVWLYDDLDWPSGMAGGRVVQGGRVDGEPVPADPELVARYLQVHARDVTGGSGQTDVALADLGEGELVTVQALPVASGQACAGADGRPTGAVLDEAGRVELTGAVAGDRVRWEPPPGRWCLVALAAHRLTGYRPERAPERLPVDYLNPEATAKFIATTHEVYEQRLGAHLGSTVVGFYDDEPGFYGDFPGGRSGPQAQGSVPWTPGFAAVLDAAEPGLTGALAALWYDVGPSTTATRVAFRQQLQERYAEAFARPLARWAAQRDTLLVSNLLVEEDLGSHQLVQGGSWFAAQRPYTLPGTDQIGGLDVTQVQPQLTASVSQVFGRDRTLAEAFGAFGWGLDMATMRRTAGWLAAGGIDLLNLHAVAVSSEGGRGRDAPPSFGEQNTMWPFLDRFTALAGRLSHPLRSGEPVTDVAMLYPSSSVLGSGTPDTNRGFEGAGPELGEVDESWRAVAGALLDAQIDLTFLDEPALAGAYPEAPVAVDSGRLRLRGAGWDVLVVPALTVLDLDALSALEDFAGAGGTILLAGRLPDREAQGRHGQLEQRLAALLERPGVTRVDGPRAVAEAVRAAGSPGVQLQPGTAQVRVRRVRRGGHEAFLLANVSTRPVTTTASLAATGAPQRWDPATGEVAPLPVWEEVAGRTVTPLRLAPGEALWLVVDTGADAGDHATHVRGGELLDLRPGSARVLVDGGEPAHGRPGDSPAAGMPAPDDPAAGTPAADPPVVEVRAVVDGRAVAGSATAGALAATASQPLDGPWTLSLPDHAEVTRPPGSWVDLAPAFSGTATYTTSVEVDPAWLAEGRRVRLDLGEVGEIAEVSVNGAPVGVLPWPPFTLDVTAALRPGRNTIAVAVTNTPLNARAPDRARPSGLLGPVHLRPHTVVEVPLRATGGGR